MSAFFFRGTSFSIDEEKDPLPSVNIEKKCPAKNFMKEVIFSDIQGIHVHYLWMNCNEKFILSVSANHRNTSMNMFMFTFVHVIYKISVTSVEKLQWKFM